MTALAIALFDWNLFKGYVERRVEASTGREFHIDGDLGVKLSMHPLITMDRLRLANVAGAKDPVMASAERLQFRIALWPLLRGQTVLPEVRLVRPTLLLERNADGSDNWSLRGSRGNPVIRQFTIESGTLTYREQATHTDLVIDVQSGTPTKTDRLAPLQFHGKGIYRDNPFALEGRADSPLDLASTTTPYRIDVDATAGPTRAHASGALRNPLQVEGFDLDFALAGPDLGLLYHLLGIAMPETPPYRLHGRLGHADHVWRFDRFTGIVGNSDLGGDVSIDDNGKRKFMQASLASRHLDVHDLAGFVGAPAHSDPAKAATPKQRAEAVQARISDRILPRWPYDLDRLRGMDADVSLRATHVVGTRVPLDALAAHMKIRDGVVHLDPMDFAAAGGQVQSRIVLDASRPVIASAARITMRSIDLGQLLPEQPLFRRSGGRFSADADLKGKGNSIAAMFATSNGRVSIGMGGGHVSDLLMADAGLNIARILKLKIVGDHDIAIRCAAADFSANEGTWTARTFVFDSADTIIRADGSIDLRDEQFHLLLHVRPKHPSLLSLRSPLRLTGSFQHPSIHPDYGALGLRGAAAAILGAVALPAAELALLEFGGGKDNNCVTTEASAK